MKAIAFYLPQFHVIPENEAVYGPGFTEWDNVRRAVSLYPGHYQPHVPHRLLGHYDLTNEATLIKQHRLALNNGISAFCYYYYNMAGKRLLEKPLDIINASPHIRNGFCLCWPHQSWYDNRSYAGADFQIQQYDAEQARALAHDLKQYFDNPRYIRIDGKPLFLVFAPDRHPMMREYSRILREEALGMGFPGLWLAGVEAYVGCHPQAYGFDGMVEFAPNWVAESQISAPGEEPRRMDYAATLKFMLSKPVPDYPRMRCTFPGWDNTPRKGKAGISCMGRPDLFTLALQGLADYTKEVLPPQLHWLFINAWNEWGEGCHLEPDQRHGMQYLDAVRTVLAGA